MELTQAQSCESCEAVIRQYIPRLGDTYYFCKLAKLRPCNEDIYGFVDAFVEVPDWCPKEQQGEH
jgi:hypothetical protein